jgi:hypothetical protein
MRYAVLVILDTDCAPQALIDELVSTLTFDTVPATDVLSVTVLTDDGDDVASYRTKVG